MRPWISIIIPARNDASALRRTLDRVESTSTPDTVEILVAASGQKSDTEAAVGGRALLLWPNCSTRAALMNVGAAAARGDVLLFLHADSLLSADALTALRDVLRDGRIVGGAFVHRFEENVWSLKLISWINRRRYSITRNYYGDQGIFVRAEIFRCVGGYRERFMEDLDFSQRVKKLGRTVVVPTPVVTSGRRFLVWGPWRAFSFIVWLLLLHSLKRDTQGYAERWHAWGERSLQHKAAVR